MTAVLLITAFVLAVLLLNEREASGKAIADRDRAVKNYKAAEKWFTAAVSMASNEQELVNTLTQIQKEERRKWDRDWHGENEMKMSINDQRHVDISTLGYLPKMHSQKKYK